MRLLEILDGIEVKNNVDKELYKLDVTAVCYDSRDAIPGCAFVCIKGFKTDGHDYAHDAEKAGASVIIAQDEVDCSVPVIMVPDTREALALMSAAWFDNPSSKFKLIGVTGTNGKTTTTYLLKAIIERAGGKVGLIGTNQNMIGDEIIPTERTTPESYELQKLFAYMLKRGVDHVVMEVSSHALELKRVNASSFDIGIFTNLTQDHLDFHQSMERYLIAKTKLFSMCTVGVINRDDSSSQYILEHSTSKNFTFSVDYSDADVTAKNLKLKPDGVEFEVVAQNDISRIELGIPGRFSVYNALGAITCARILGISKEIIADALKYTTGVKGRVEVVPTDTDYTVIIDYAHTPDGISNVLSAVSSFAKGRIVILFGCGGDRDSKKRPLMGKIASDMADFCIVTSDNPRTEDPQRIIDDILVGIKDSKAEYVVIPSRMEAIEFALRNAQKDDIIVLAGKGHETYQILKDKTIHFDEREIVAEILQKISKEQ